MLWGVTNKVHTLDTVMKENPCNKRFYKKNNFTEQKKYARGKMDPKGPSYPSTSK